MFASQMGSGEAGIISTIQYTGIYYYAVDLNGNKAADANELLLGLGNAGYYGFDPVVRLRMSCGNGVEFII